jgi:hypothetical protein
MLRWLWKFIGNSKNRQILSWLGGGAIAIATAVWATIVYFHPPIQVSRTETD